MIRVFEVTLTIQVLMEAENATEARECMRVRCCREISQAEEHEITAVEVTVKPEDRGRVLVV